MTKTHKRTTPKIFGRAKQLHREMPPAEAKLWKHLRAHRMGDVHFRNHTAPAGRCRGHAIGNNIVDFVAPRRKLIIELDGSQHLEQKQYDAERTTFLKSKGYHILRFWNNDVLNDLESVLKEIFATLNDPRQKAVEGIENL